MIVIRFLKVLNELVVFKNDRFFPKMKRSFLKTIEKLNKKQSFNDRFQTQLTTLATPDKVKQRFTTISLKKPSSDNAIK